MFEWPSSMTATQKELERWLEHLGNTKPPRAVFAPRVWEPPVDIYETEQEIVVLADVAGASQEMEVVVDSNTLVIRGERKEGLLETRRTYHQMEIPRGPFERGILLPATVDTEQIKVSYEDGILEIVLSKMPEVHTHKIKVKTVSF